MLRRTTALALWAYFAWYLGSMVADALGLPALLGPMAGIALAAYALNNWRRHREIRRPAPAKELQLSR